MQLSLQAAKGRKNTLIKYSALAIKVLILLIAGTYAYKKIFISHNPADIISHYENLLTLVPFLLLALVVILSFVNWGLEAMKWKYSLYRFEKITFYKSMEAVLSGLTVSLAAPNRTGEFAGRIIHLVKLNKIKASVITIVGSFSQFLTTFICGIAGATIIAFTHPQYLFVDVEKYLPAAAVVATILVLIYFNPSLFLVAGRWLYRKSLIYLNVLNKYSRKELAVILLFSVLRYFVFALQFYILLCISGIVLPFHTGVALISLVYFITTFIPTTTISELAVRWSVSVAVFSMVTGDYLAIVNATFMLWLVNLFFPAIPGGFFLLKAGFFKKAAHA